MSKAQILGISYDVWKSVVQGNNLTAYFHEDDGVTEQGSAFAGTNEYIYTTRVVNETWDDFDGYFPSGTRVNVSRRDDAIANIVGLSNIPERTRTTSDNILRVTSEKPTEGIKLTIISSDWGDPCTWYYKSRKILDGYVLDNINTTAEKLAGTYTKYEGYGTWIDNFHGRYSDEDYLTNDIGEVPRLKVYVDGYEKTEVDPHTGEGDFTVDYENAQVIFNSTVGSEAVVSVDAWLAQESTWSIVPNPGTKIIIDYVEVQFSADIKLTDSVVFQSWVYNPYDLPNKVPYGDPTKYKSMKDYINEANRSYPLVLKTTHQSPGWRDLQTDYNIYVWDYQSVLEISSSVGAEIRIALEHDVPFEGSATAAFYCRVFEE